MACVHRTVSASDVILYYNYYWNDRPGNGEMSAREKERIDELVQGKEDLLDENKWKALREAAVKDTEDKVYQHT